MEEERYQKELFEFKKPKRTFPKLSNFLPKADFERNILITLSLEKVIFISIGILMVMVIVYALGVEMGSVKTEERLIARMAVKKAPQMAAPAKIKALPAVIMVAGSFTQKENAMIAITRLRQAGFDAYLGQTQPRFQVWVGVRQGADPLKELARLKLYSRDAYIKTK